MHRRGISAFTGSQVRSKPVIDEAHDDLDSLIHNGTELSRALQRESRNIMWEQCGVVREASDMEQALGMLDEVRSVLPSVDVRPSEEGWGDLAHVLDVQAMLGTAEATLRGDRSSREPWCPQPLGLPRAGSGDGGQFHRGARQ